mmetsp:Transcript_43907/g.70591  ORF Transcript_43907/g.70591 Transcript_43907/m.70591 type:complete len:350 (+) Transcript_43907:2-1051(+)
MLSTGIILAVLAISLVLTALALVGKILVSRSNDRFVRVRNLYVYPVKSCGATELKEAEITRLGLKWDRSFVVADSKSNEMVSQRKYPKMALIQPTVEEKDGTITLTLSYPGQSPHEEKLTKADISSMPKVEVKVWKDVISAVRCSSEAAQWLTKVIGVECYLVSSLGEQAHWRPAADGYKTHEGDQAGAFSDGFPFLLASQESLDALNAKLKMKGELVVPMDRFRPNIVVKNVSEPFAEDYWAQIQIGASTIFRVAKPCSRCSMPTVDQKIGQRHPKNEPSRTLKTFRMFRWVKSTKEEVYFGQNLICAKKTGRIRVDDPVKVRCVASGVGRQNSIMTQIMVTVAEKLL